MIAINSVVRIILLLIPALIFFTIAAVQPARSAIYDNYPSKWKNASISTVVDDWGYYNRNCTSWSAWALRDKNGFEVPRGMGDARNWGSQAQNKGFAVNMYPAKGSIAWWDGTKGMGSNGHVAWVEFVSGGNVMVQEYNVPYGSGNFNRRWIPKNSVSGYIHFKDLADLDTDFNRDGRADIYTINRRDAGSGSTAYHVINGANPWQYLQNTATALHQTDDNWEFEVADYNRDNIPDIYVINKQDWGSGRTALHVLNGANPGQFLLHFATALHPTDGNWDFEVGDYNRDGTADLYAINRYDPGSGRSSYHVLNGLNPSEFLLHTSTVLHPTDFNWDFELADFNNDAMLDLYAVNRNDPGSSRTAYHVINGLNPSQFLINTATVLHPTDYNWDFETADYNRDGRTDVYAINRQDLGSGRTAIHVINGYNPGQFLLNSPSVLHPTDGNWSFGL